MDTQPDERNPEIEKLLAELRSDDPNRRQAAAEKIAELRLSNEEVINVLKNMAETDAVMPVREAAVNALKSLSGPPVVRPNMATQPPDPEIDKLLRELRSDDPKRREASAHKIAKLRLHDNEVIHQLKLIAKTDPNLYARYAASDALSTLAKPFVALSRRAKIADFTIGFVGWYALNGVAWFLVAQQPGFTLQGNAIESYGFIGLCLWPANVLALIVLAVARPGRWIALGLLAAIASNFIIALILGASTGAYCFIPFFTSGLR
jgi:hypothetical protein